MDSDSDLVSIGGSPVSLESSLPDEPVSINNGFIDKRRRSEQVDAQNTVTADILEKQDWVKRMRLQFCRRKEFEITFRMIHDDGTINQDYFRPKLQELQKNHQEQLEQIELKKWTDSHKDKLCQGIQEFGIGKFKEISEKFLPDWTVNELRLKAMRLIGRQNLQLYRGWKGNAHAISREFEYNKKVGIKFNTWKNSTLVYDDEGRVYEYLTRSR